MQRFPIPTLDVGDQITITEELTLPVSHEDIYHVTMEADSDEIVYEQDEDNNRVEIVIPIVVTVTLQPSTTTALTSNSGHLAFLFPAGIVTTPVDIHLTPLLPSKLPSGPLSDVTAFRLAAYRGEQPTTLSLILPVTVTWQYTDTDVAGLDEEQLELYRLTEGELWERVTCPTERRYPEANQLHTCIQQLGTYVFGLTYKRYIPVLWLGEERVPGIQSEVQEMPAPRPGTPPGLPLRFPPSVPASK